MLDACIACRQFILCQDNQFCNKPVQAAKETAGGGLLAQSAAYGGG